MTTPARVVLGVVDDSVCQVIKRTDGDLRQYQSRPSAPLREDCGYV